MKNYLLIDGKKYLSSREASRLTGYTSDYVGQLSRSKKINSKLIGRAWYVEEKSLIKYKNLGLEEASKFRSSVSREPHFTSSFGNVKYLKFTSISFLTLVIILFITTIPVKYVAQSLLNNAREISMSQSANITDSLRSLLRNFIGTQDGKTQVVLNSIPVATTTITNKTYTNPTTYVTYKTDTNSLDTKIANLQNQLDTFKYFQSRQTDAIYNSIGNSIANISNTNVSSSLSDLSTFTTGDLTEGSNLYFTSARILSTLNYSTSTAFGGDVIANSFYGDGSNLTGITSFSTSTTRGVFSATSSLTYDSVNGVFGISTSTLDLTTLDNLYSIGTITSGVWNGTTIGDSYLTKSGDWTGTFDGQEGSYYLDRANHTGMQLSSTISDFTTNARGLFSSLATGLNYTSGTGVFSLTSGYGIPLAASTTNWDTAYANRITSATSPLSISSNVISISTSTLGLTTSDVPEGSRLYYTTDRFDTRLAATTSLPNITTLANLYSIGTITSGVWNATTIGDAYLTKSGDWTGTFDGQEGTYYLDRTNHTSTQLASTISDFSSTGRGLLSSSATGLTYTSGTGDFSLTSGYSIPLTASTTNWNGFYDTPSSRITAGNGLSWSGNTLSSTATTTAGTGLTYSGNAFNVNTSQNISTLSNLTSNGFVKTSGGTGALSIDTTTYLSGTVGIANGGTGQTSFGQGWLNSDGTTITSSTSPTVNYITATSTTATSTFAGAVGIGTTTPTTKLTIQGTTGTNPFLVASSTGSPLLTVTQAGNLSVTGSVTATSFSGSSASSIDTSGQFLGTNLQLYQAAGNSNIWQTFRPDLKYLGMMSDHQLVWRSASTGSFFSSGSIDTGINRFGAGVVAATNGSTGTGSFRGDFFTATSTTATSTFAGAVGIGTTTPGAFLHSLGTTEQLRLGFDATKYASFTTSSVGKLTIASVGTNGDIAFTPSGTGAVTSAAVFKSGVAGTGAYWVDGGSSSGIASVYGGGQLGLRYGGTITAGVNNAGINLGISQLTFAATSPNTAKDLAIQRNSAGVLEVNSGSAGTWRDLIVRNLSMGTTSTSTTLTVQGEAGKNIFSIASSTGTNLLTVSQSGNLGIGSSSPAYGLSVAGTVGFSGLSLSTTGNYLCMDTVTNQITSGTLCTLSSSRFKQNIQDLNLGLDAVLALKPVTFKFKQGYGDNGATEQLGFVAEQADAIDPRLVPHDKDGLPSGFNYQNYTAVLTKAIQEQQLQINSLKNATSSSTTIIQQTYISATSAEPTESFISTVATAVKSLISSAGEFVVSTIRSTLAIFDRVETKELCIGTTCVTEDQLKELLSRNNVTASVYVPPSDISTTTPEIVATSTPTVQIEETTATSDAVIEPTSVTPITPEVILEPEVAPQEPVVTETTP